MSKRFKLIKDVESGYVYCCRLNQTLQERMIEKAKQPMIPEQFKHKYPNLTVGGIVSP